MGELHLEIYVERMKREYNVECTTGKPRVAFRETITQRADFFYTHKKQTGGAGQYARVIGFVEPMEMNEETGKDTEFVNQVMGGNIPSNYIPACEKVRILVPAAACSFLLTVAVHHDRDSTKLSRRALFPATRSPAYVLSLTTVSRTRSIRPSWPSDLRLSVLSVRCTGPRGQSSLSPS